ncbi:methionine--tRNA ligase [Candidatus Riesia sp. GBBU]|nr:methionine--tRNA ligase [Candidatus Riesia sp. GBBU]ARC55052.1 methionine--tRNA ligase [Candidatus Riesia sp. GBBU]
MNTSKKILVTCALPYSNGSIHLGHILEHVQADIWVRHKKMIGEKVFFVCADDSHGTPIMLKSKKLGISPEKLINETNKEHYNDLKDFSINYDNYYTTHSKENKETLEDFYKKLKNNGYIKKKVIFQMYDEKEKIFLPDRFIKGTCPKCKSKNQNGDNCETCGSIHNSTELIDPFSTISKNFLIKKKTEHIFFDLPKFKEILKNWIKSLTIKTNILNKVKEWIKIGLKELDISRDHPYFGFKIPNEKNKYFYVWIDATIGYIGTVKNLEKKRKIKLMNFWEKNSTSEVFHFIGKDIVQFHIFLWPSLLEGVGYKKPKDIFVHGHVTINKKKMSKSGKNFILARSYLNFLNSEYLRYYYATKLSSKSEDIDINLKDLLYRVNGEIINKVINLASRNAKFINKYFLNFLSAKISDDNIYNRFLKEKEKIIHKFHNREYQSITKKIMFLADMANFYINKKSPWKLIKENKRRREVHEICSTGINLFKVLMTYLKPITPKTAIRSEIFLNTSLNFRDISKPLVNHKIKNFKCLLKKVSKKKLFLLHKETMLIKK